MHPFRLVLPALALCAIIASSCGKKNNTSGTNCRIVGLSDNIGSSTSHVSFTYDDQGRLTSIVATGGNTPIKRVFTYSGNIEMISETLLGVTTTDSIVLSSDGLPEIDQLRTSGGTQTLSTYTYAGSEIQTVTNQSSPVSTTDFYAWTGGNVTWSNVGINNAYSASSIQYFYDTTAPSQPGDYWQMIQLEGYGFTFIRNANLVTHTNGIDNGDTTAYQTFAYTFDSDHKITQLVMTYGMTVETITYQYSCD
jgi:YD repeat-containing protein